MSDWINLLPGLLVILGLLFLGFPALLVASETRPIEPLGEPADLHALPPDVADHLAPFQKQFASLGLQFSSTVRIRRHPSSDAGINRYYFVFRDASKNTVAWRIMLTGASNAATPTRNHVNQTIVLTLLPGDRSVQSTQGPYPDLSTDPERSALWESGANLESILKNHKRHLASLGKKPRDISAMSDSDLLTMVFRREIAGGLASGNLVACSDGASFRMSFNFARQLVWRSFPPGRWFWKNPNP